MDTKEAKAALIKGAKGTDSEFVTVVREHLLLALGESTSKTRKKDTTDDPSKV